MIDTAWCVYCRGVIEDDADRCPTCGKPLTDGSKVIQCPSCAKFILKSSAQCRFCGKDPHAAEAPAESEEAPAPAKPAASTEQPVSAEQATPAEPPAAQAKPAEAAKPAPTSTPAAQPAKAKPRGKRAALLIPLILLLAAALFFGGRVLFGRKGETEETRGEYIASCKAVAYAMISRDPARYEGDRLTFSGTVTDMVAGGTVVFHIDQLDLDNALGSDPWYAVYTPADGDERVLREGDEITVYGECVGAETYSVQPGESVTVPSVRVLYYEAAELDKLIAAQQGETFRLGETWTINGLCTVTVTGVTETKDRSPNAKTAPVAVYYVDYTYTNLGYRSESADGIYVALDEFILDSAGKIGFSYPNAVADAPRPTPVGETCSARCCIGLDHPGAFQLTVNVNAAAFNLHTARFNLMAE